MMTGRENDIRVTHEAARWLMELQTEGKSCYAAFAQWLRRSPEHIEEFLAITGMSRRLDGIDPQKRIDIEALLADDGAQIVRLLPAAGQSDSSPSPRRMRTRWASGMAAACAIAGIFLLLKWTAFAPETYVTHTGEQQSFKLADGSVINLNTRSRVQVRFSDKVREVLLLDGEALFTVERDPARPFRVLAGVTTVQAIGTQFNVYHSPATTTVSVMEGAVQVSKAGQTAGPDESTQLTAGEQAAVRNGRIEKQTLADVKSIAAWRERRLIFQDRPLADVVAEFNRYNTVQFEVDEDAGREPLSGVFAADRPDSLALFLAKDESIRIERRGQRFVIRSNRTR